jgi:type IV fimbrial biogenesis protein FimT
MLVLKQKIARAVKYAKGFSLVELLVVVAILAIISGFGIPAFKTWIADAKTRTVAEALQNGLRLAQTEAIKRGVQVQFVLTDSAPNATVTSSSTTGINWVAQSMLRATPGTVDQFIQGANLSAVSSARLVSATDATVIFNSLGRLVSPTTPVTYTLSNADGARHLNLTISLAGKIRMCDPDKNLTNSPDGCVAS